jgi:hypothetical protein
MATASAIQSAFFDYVFNGDEGYICIATQLPGERQTFKEQFFKWPKNKDLALGHIQRHAQKHNVWFGVNLLSNPKRGKEYCLPCNLLWADLDTCDPTDVVPKPQCVIESSPKRYQAIWRMDEKIDPYMAEQYSKRIAYAYRVNGADPSGWDLTQLLRVPHTFNFKYNETPRVELSHAFETLAPLAALAGLPELFDNSGNYDLEVPEDLPDADATILKYWSQLNRTAFQTLYEEEPEFDWSRVLWRLLNICFELKPPMSEEEAFAVALNAKCNKYARDGRPLSHLWREVQRASESQSKLRGLLKSYTPLEIPQLLTTVEAASLPYTLIDDYHDWAVASTDAIADYHDLTFFIVLSSLIAGGLHVNTSYGVIQPNLWGLVLGDSTLSRKTTAMKMGMSFVEEIDRERILATDASAEGMLSGLSGRPNQVSIFFRDEVSGFLDSVRRKDYMAGLPEVMTQLYDIPPILTRRLRKETITVTSPVFIFFGGGIRDKTYSLINEQMILSGFLPRFLVVSGNADLGSIRRTGPAIVTNIEKRAEIAQKLHRVYDAYNISGEFMLAGQKITEVPAKVEALLSNEAWQRYGDIEMAMAHAANNAVISHLALPTFERASRSLLKMCLLVAAIRREPDDNVLEVIEEDVNIAAKYLQQWLPFSVDLIANSGQTTTQRLLENVINAIRKEPGIMRGKVMQHYHLSRREMDDVQNTLEDRGQIRVERKGKAAYLYPED